jgi:hypothetical protein
MRLPLAALVAIALVPTGAVLAQDDTVKPKLTGVSLAPSAFKPNAKGPTVAKHGGTVVKFTISEDANVSLGVDRRTATGTWKPYPGGENFDVTPAPTVSGSAAGSTE